MSQWWNLSAPGAHAYTPARAHTLTDTHKHIYRHRHTHTRARVFCGRPSAVWVTERIMSRIQDCFNCACVCVRACVRACVWTGGIDWGTLWGSAPAVCITDMMCAHVCVCVSFVVRLHACLFLHRARYCTLMHVVLVRACASLSSGVRVCVRACNMSV